MIDNLDVEGLLVQVREKIGQGSNSNVYRCTFQVDGKGQEGVIKMPPNPMHYMSLNIQRYSYELCAILNDKGIRIPKVHAYAMKEGYGDMMVLEKIDHIYPVDHILKHELGYSELIVQHTAKAIAYLHQLGISGYDVEFLWDVMNHQLVLLDIGPIETINASTFLMLHKHLEIEQKHVMGTWNIISQILPQNVAIALKENNKVQTVTAEMLLVYMQDYGKHIRDAAATNALSILGVLTADKKNQYIQLFKRTYRKAFSREMTWHERMYLRSFEQAIYMEKVFAEARLYNTDVEPLSICSCKVEIS